MSRKGIPTGDPFGRDQSRQGPRAMSGQGRGLPTATRLHSITPGKLPTARLAGLAVGYLSVAQRGRRGWTHQAYDQGALLSQLDLSGCASQTGLAVLLGVKEQTADLYPGVSFPLWQASPYQGKRATHRRRPIAQTGDHQPVPEGIPGPCYLSKNKSLKRSSRTLHQGL